MLDIANILYANNMFIIIINSIIYTTVSCIGVHLIGQVAFHECFYLI